MSAAQPQELVARVAELEALLDHYRGMCDDCCRDGVLLDFRSDYDGMRTICLQDRKECERLTAERNARQAEEHRAKVAAGDPLAVMTDNFMRATLDLSRQHKPLAAFKPGAVVEWVTSYTTPD